MTLGTLKTYLESLPAGSIFDYSLSHPFSWRGIYNEVAFAINHNYSTREELLEKVEAALTEEFEAYKGGDYRYTERTPVHFEDDISCYTDGGYTERWISQLLESDPVESPEHRLVSLLFK